MHYIPLVIRSFRHKGTYAVDVSGNLRLTFRFDSGDAIDTDLEDYH